MTFSFISFNLVDIHDIYCFRFYISDFKNKEVDSEMFRMISEYQTSKIL